MYTDDERLSDQRGQLTNPLPAADAEPAITWRLHTTCEIARMYDGVYTVIGNRSTEDLSPRPTWVEAWRGSDVLSNGRSLIKRKLSWSTSYEDVERAMRHVLTRLHTPRPPDKSRKSGRCG